MCILELRSPLSASCFNLQLIDVFSNLKDLARNCGFVIIAESIGDFIFLSEDAFRSCFEIRQDPQKGGFVPSILISPTYVVETGNVANPSLLAWLYQGYYL